MDGTDVVADREHGAVPIDTSMIGSVMGWHVHVTLLFGDTGQAKSAAVIPAGWPRGHCTSSIR
jgi:hypothetical protein